MFSLNWLWRRWATPYQRQDIEKAAKAFPADHPIQAVLASANVQEAITTYETEDGKAMLYQRWNRIYGRFIWLMAIIGLAISALSLLPFVRQIIPLAQDQWAALQVLMLYLLTFGGKQDHFRGDLETTELPLLGERPDERRATPPWPRSVRESPVPCCRWLPPGW